MESHALVMARRPHRGTELRRLRAVRADIRVHSDPHPRLCIRVEARAGDSRAKVENSVAHAAPAFPETKRPDLSAPHSWLARAFAHGHTSATVPPDDCFRRSGSAQRASALATFQSPGASSRTAQRGLGAKATEPTLHRQLADSAWCGASRAIGEDRDSAAACAALADVAVGAAPGERFPAGRAASAGTGGHPSAG